MAKGKWSVIHSHRDLDESKYVTVGSGRHPLHIGTQEFPFNTKDEALKKYAESFNEYEKIAYDWKSHGDGAFKFYYEKDGKDLLTYVLLHFNGVECDQIDMEKFERYILEARER